MKFKVEGFRRKAIYVVIEANSPDEAIKKAREDSGFRFLEDRKALRSLGFELTGAVQVDELWKKEPTAADLRRQLSQSDGLISMQKIVREIIKMHLHLSKSNLRQTVLSCLRSLHNSLSAFAKNNHSSICYSADLELRELYKDFRECSLRKWLPDFTPKALPTSSIQKIVKEVFYLFSDISSQAERIELTWTVLRAIHKFFLESDYKDRRVLVELEKQIKALG
jgi:hypothetical protein